MEMALTTERLTGVTDTDPLQARVEALVEQRDRHEISVDRLTRAANFSHQTWYNLVNGKGARSTRERNLESFERALADLIAHPEDIAEEPTHVVSTPEGLIEFEVTGDFGVRVIVRGPVGNADELERAAAKIIRDIRGSQGS